MYVLTYASADGSELLSAAENVQDLFDLYILDSRLRLNFSDDVNFWTMAADDSYTLVNESGRSWLQIQNLSVSVS